MKTVSSLWTRPQGNREKREKFGLRGQKSEKRTLPRPQGKTREPANTGLSGHKKGGQRKSVPPHMVVDGLPLRNFLFALKHASEY
jgi:hypothetical protein